MNLLKHNKEAMQKLIMINSPKWIKAYMIFEYKLMEVMKVAKN